MKLFSSIVKGQVNHFQKWEYTSLYDIDYTICDKWTNDRILSHLFFFGGMNLFDWLWTNYGIRKKCQWLMKLGI